MTTDRRSWMLGAAAGALAACGGGSVALPASCGQPLVSIYGDSVQSGSYAATPTATERSYLNPRPSERVARQAGVRVIDHAVPGWTIAEWAQGWESTVQTDPAGVIVLRLGGADAVAQTGSAEFEARADWMTGVAIAASRRVVVVGVIHSKDAGLDARAASLDAALRRVSQRRGVPFVDIRALPFDPSLDIADAVHPAQGYADRCADAIAQAVEARA